MLLSWTIKRFFRVCSISWEIPRGLLLLGPSDNVSSMSTVPEIEAALSRLHPEDFLTVERWMAEFKKHQEAKDPYDYAIREYAVTPAELDRFDARMKKEIEADRQCGELREFTVPGR